MAIDMDSTFDRFKVNKRGGHFATTQYNESTFKVNVSNKFNNHFCRKSITLPQSIKMSCRLAALFSRESLAKLCHLQTPMTSSEILTSNQSTLSNLVVLATVSNHTVGPATSNLTLRCMISLLIVQMPRKAFQI